MKNLRNIVGNPELPGQPVSLENHGLGYLLLSDNFHRLYFAYFAKGQEVHGSLVRLSPKELTNFITYYDQYLTTRTNEVFVKKKDGSKETSIVILPARTDFDKSENGRYYDPLFDNTYLP